MIAPLARPPVARLLRTRGPQVAASAWAVSALAFAFAAHWGGSSHAADRVLLELYGPIVLPLLAYALVGAVVNSRSLSYSISPLVAFGAIPARAAAFALAVAAAACAIVGGLVAAGVDVLAHGSSDAPLAHDAMASGYAGALGGAAYAAWLVLGTCCGRRGGGRLAFLVADWVLGSGHGAGALLTPRGHVRNLLGGLPPMDLSEQSSAVALVALAIACALIALWRTG